MAELTCEEFRDMSGELALGVADARQRAAAIDHLQRCPACRSEERDMAEVADALVGLVPPAEPPAGFETRLLASMGRQPPVRAHPSSILRAGQLAAAVVVAALIGTAGWLIGDHSSHPPTPSGGHVVTAELLGGGRRMGQVIVAGGAEPWMSMAVQTETGSETVRCDLRMQDGKTVTEGWFPISNGYGYWAAPIRVDSGDRVVAADVVGPGGAVLASAAIPAT